MSKQFPDEKNMTPEEVTIRNRLIWSYAIIGRTVQETKDVWIEYKKAWISGA